MALPFSVETTNFDAIGDPTYLLADVEQKNWT